MFWSVESAQLSGRHSDPPLTYLPAARIGPSDLRPLLLERVTYVSLEQGSQVRSVRICDSVPPSQLDLFVSDPPSCVQHAPKCVLTLTIPYPSVVKE